VSLSYWTLKVWVVDHRGPFTVAAFLLHGLEEQIASVFFPTPGPAKIQARMREETQRQLLAEHGVQIDVEDFIAGNPILLRDRKAASSGCAASVVLLVTIAAVALLGIV
jgi:hypothetical protein